MTDTVPRRKIEVLVDGPLVPKIAAAAAGVGVSAYTLLPVMGGSGRSGRWTDDQVTGVESKLMFMTVTSEEKAAALIDALAPILESHRLLLISSEVAVVRAGKF